MGLPHRFLRRILGVQIVAHFWPQKIEMDLRVSAFCCKLMGRPSSYCLGLLLQILESRSQALSREPFHGVQNPKA